MNLDSNFSAQQSHKRITPLKTQNIDSIGNVHNSKDLVTTNTLSGKDGAG